MALYEPRRLVQSRHDREYSRLKTRRSAGSRNANDVSDTMTTGHKAQHAINTLYDAIVFSSAYDPGSIAYKLAESRYDAAHAFNQDSPTAIGGNQPAFGHSSHPSLLGMGIPEVDHDLVAWMLREFVNNESDRVNRNAPSEIANLFNPEHDGRLSLPELELHVEAMQDYTASVNAGNEIDALTSQYFQAPSANDEWSAAISEMTNHLEAAAEAMQLADTAFDAPQQDYFPSPPETPTYGGWNEPAAGLESVTQQDALHEAFGSTNDAQLEQIVEDEMMHLDQFAVPNPMMTHQMDPFGQAMPPGFGPM